VAERFDIVYSWSVFEHVDRALLDATAELLREALHPGGVLFVQVAPLFFSARGSHLAPVLPEPWLHLRLPEETLHERLSAATSPAQCEALWSTYRGLNRITAFELIELLQRHGFEIRRTHATRDRETPGEDLIARWPGDALTTEQIVILARR
jgi:hypothetical protein